MFAYMVRRILYLIPILVGVNFLTFSLFFLANSPDEMARVHLGGKYVTTEAIKNWKQSHGYDHPLFYNAQKKGWQKITQTIFYQKSIKLFVLDFGSSDMGRNIGYDVSQRMWPSLAIAVPSLLLSLVVDIGLAMLIIFFRNTYLDILGVILCVILISVSGLFYIIGGQYLFAKLLKLVPISGYVPSWQIGKFLILPILISVISGLGSGIRWYRTLFLEEIRKDYVRTARAKGLRESLVLFKHVFRNALIPILTNVVALLPLLFLGSLLIESFFGIPGLGSYTLDAIQQQDFAIVRSMVFLGSGLYIIGLLLTDVSYTLADPRVRLG